MTAMRFLTDFYAVDGAGNSFVKFLRGGIYQATDETFGQVAAGFAETVDTPEPSLVADTAPSEAPSGPDLAAQATAESGT